MEEFDFEETNLSTSIDKLRKKKTELDDEKPYNLIRKNLYNELNSQPHVPPKTSVYVPDNILTQTTKKNKKHKHKTKKQTDNYYNLFVFSIIFILVNNFELHTYLINQRFGYYTIVIIKLILFIAINYIFKHFTKKIDN